MIDREHYGEMYFTTMASKNDDNFIAFCNELRAYVEEHHLFPPKHTNLLSHVKYTRKKIKDGTLEDWKREMLERN